MLVQLQAQTVIAMQQLNDRSLASPSFLPPFSTVGCGVCGTAGYEVDQTGSRRSLSEDGSSVGLDYPACQPHNSFTRVSFDDAHLVRSNLGGLGGMCTADPDKCTADVSGSSSSSEDDIYISGVGVSASGESIDMRISNETEYRAWKAAINGIKQTGSDVESSGYFAVINLLAPREASSGSYWHETLTFVQLRYSFVGSSSGLPILLDRTFLTFCVCT
jgi:hypothetical protein